MLIIVTVNKKNQGSSYDISFKLVLYVKFFKAQNIPITIAIPTSEISKEIIAGNLSLFLIKE